MKQKIIRNTETEEHAIQAHAKEDGTDLTASELASFKPIEAHPDQAAKVGRPIKEHPKQPTTIRLDADILSAFKAGGKGWQTRINDALREWLAQNKLA
ncbi:MAG: hypothetical protein CSA11_12015 [Chloroflexi bacterium]|nr:MAG: hypothetical protein CSA11_12015 [Chloroflexota bacterium]